MRIPRVTSALGAAAAVLLPVFLSGGTEAAAAPSTTTQVDAPPAMEPLSYGNPGLRTDLTVGLWAEPMPMDVNKDGKLDLLVSSNGTPHNGLYYYENTSGDPDHPVFRAAKRLSAALDNAVVSHVPGGDIVTTPGYAYPDVAETGFARPEKIPFDGSLYPPGTDLRGNQWSYVDWDHDGTLDLAFGIGDWTDYGGVAGNAFDDQGNWTNGPLHGSVLVARNEGTNAAPRYAPAVKLTAGGAPIDVYGKASPVFADFDGDGRQDLVAGEFLDKMTLFRNIGTDTSPRYAKGERVIDADGKPIAMDLEMITVSAVDWNKDGHPDLVVGQEDGRVALIENTGKLRNGRPTFEQPVFFKAPADQVSFGILSTPSSCDWDGDGKPDLIAGNSAGYLGFLKNLNGGDPPRWAAARYLAAGGETIRIQAGKNGSIQGPAEAKWGYTTPMCADWNKDGLPDILVNDIWGKVFWYQNIGDRTHPRLAAAQPIEVQWTGDTPKPKWNWWQPEGDDLVTQWRTNPYVTDINDDGLPDLVMLDQEGYLTYFERQRTHDGRLVLLPPQRIFIGEAGSSKFTSNNTAQAAPEGPLQMNSGEAGASGRRKFTMVDWNGDGKLDLIVNSTNLSLLENVGDAAHPFLFRNRGPIAVGRLAGHTTQPAVVNWDHDGHPDLVIGAEDGRLYYQKWNYDYFTRPPRTSTPPAQPGDLVGSWPLDEPKGAIARDVSGNDNYGVLNGAPVFDKAAGGLALDGFNDFVDLGHTVGPYLDGAHSIAFSASVNRTSFERSTKLFGTRINGGTAGFEVRVDGNTVTLAGRSKAGDAYQTRSFDAAPLTIGKWHQVRAVIDLTHRDMALYVDGVAQQADETTPLSFGSDTYVYGNPTQPDTIGAGPDHTSEFRGLLRDVRVEVQR